MNKGKIISLLIGIGLLVWAIFHFLSGLYLWAVIKLLVGGSLISLAFIKNRYGMIIFGHMAIVAGAILITAGIYFAPFVSDSIRNNGGNIPLRFIFGMPLFWGFFSIFGGICAIYHGFCKCVRKEWKN